MSLKIKKEVVHGYNESEIFQRLQPKIDIILKKDNEDEERKEFLRKIHQNTQIFWFLVQNYYYENALKTKFQEQGQQMFDKMLKQKYDKYKKFEILSSNVQEIQCVEFNKTINNFIQQRLVKENQSFKEIDLQPPKQAQLDTKDFATFLYMFIQIKEIFYNRFMPDQEHFSYDVKLYKTLMQQSSKHRYDITQRIRLNLVKKLIMDVINNKKRDFNLLLEEALKKQKIIQETLQKTKKHLKKNYLDTRIKNKERGVLSAIQRNELQKKKDQVNIFQIQIKQNPINIPNQDLVCVICQKKEETAVNLVFLCSSCNVPVHVKCYQLKQMPSKDWYCDKCQQTDKDIQPCCLLCQQKTQILKLVNIPVSIYQNIQSRIQSFNKPIQFQKVENLNVKNIKEEYAIKKEDIYNNIKIEDDSIQVVKEEVLIQDPNEIQYNIKVETMDYMDTIKKEIPSSSTRQEIIKYTKQWIHLSCLIFNNQIELKNDRVEKIGKLMYDTCKICNDYGVVVKCHGSKLKKDHDCYSKFHIDCGIKAGFNLNDDSKDKNIQCIYHSPCNITELIYNEHEIRKQNIYKLQKFFESAEKKQIKLKQQGFKSIQKQSNVIKTRKTRKKVEKKKPEKKDQKTLQQKSTHKVYAPTPKKVQPEKTMKLQCYQILKFFDKHTQQCMDVVRHWMTYQKDYSDRIEIQIKPNYKVKLNRQTKNVFISKLDIKNRVWQKLKKDHFDHKKYLKLRKQILYLYRNQKKHIEFLQDKIDVQRCICGQPEGYQPMFQCDSCHQWFHLQCQNKNLNIEEIQNQTTCCVKCEQDIQQEFNFHPSEIQIDQEMLEEPFPYRLTQALNEILTSNEDIISEIKQL